MSRPRALALVDSATDVVGRVGPWVAVLWISALPSRFLLVLLYIELVELGTKARGYGLHLSHLAYAILAAWLVSLWGRQVFVRACRHALQSERPPPRSLLAVPPAELAAHVAAALVIELAFWALLLTFVAPVALLVAAGLAAAAAPGAGPGLWKPLRAIAESSGSLLLLTRLLAIFAVALAFAALNLHWFAHLGLWLAGGLAGLETAAWDALLAFENPLYRALVAAGATLLLEPFWLAALTAHVENTRAVSSGDDLRRWFAELRARA